MLILKYFTIGKFVSLHMTASTKINEKKWDKVPNLIYMYMEPLHTHFDWIRTDTLAWISTLIP